MATRFHFFKVCALRDPEIRRYKGAFHDIGCLLLCCNANTKIHSRKNDKNNGSKKVDHIGASLGRFTMHKLPVVTLCLIAALSAMTAFICLSEAVAPRDTEYGSGKAVFKHYIVQYVR